MKTTTTLLLIFIALLLMPSCAPEELEAPKPRPVKLETDFNDAMMQRDTISKDGDEIDPPVRPKP